MIKIMTGGPELKIMMPFMPRHSCAKNDWKKTTEYLKNEFLQINQVYYLGFIYKIRKHHNQIKMEIIHKSN